MMIRQHSRIRNSIKRILHSQLTKNFRVLDTLGANAGKKNTSTKQQLEALHAHTAADNVHLKETGYMLLVTSIMQEASELLCPDDGCAVISDTRARTTTWHGFISTAGIGRSCCLKIGQKKSRDLVRRQALPYVKR
jgi:hypothetical protein